MRFAVFPLLLASISAFTSETKPRRVTTQLASLAPDAKDISYGEESRKYRRTVYTHDDWVKHRSSDRFVRNILTTINSGIYKNIGAEAATITGIATFVVVWNMLTGGYTDFEGISHDAVIQNQYLPTLTLPLAGFTLASPFLGLLLGE